MILKLRLLTLCAAFAVALTQIATAQYIEVFSEADAAGGIASPNLSTVATSGGVAYAVTSKAGAPAAEGEVVAYDGSTFTTVSTSAQWAAGGSTNNVFASEGAGVVTTGPTDVLRFIHFLDNAAYDIDLSSGAVTQSVPKNSFDLAAGAAVNLGAQFEVAADGSIYSLDAVTDQILFVSPGNAVSVEINTADLAAAAGGTVIRGLGVQGTNVLIGSNSNDSLIAWNTVTNTSSVVLDTATIDGVTDDVDGVVAFGDIFAAPDGLVYFYEADADFLLSYDPADPAGTLGVVLTEAQFIAGPGSDTINQLSWWDGNIAWTDGSRGFYTVPEPTSALLGLIGLVGFTATRRR